MASAAPVPLPGHVLQVDGSHRLRVFRRGTVGGFPALVLQVDRQPLDQFGGNAWEPSLVAFQIPAYLAPRLAELVCQAAAEPEPPPPSTAARDAAA